MRLTPSALFPVPTPTTGRARLLAGAARLLVLAVAGGAAFGWSGAAVADTTAPPVITTVTGTGVPGYTGDGGPASAAAQRSPGDVVVDSSGDLFITNEYTCVVREVLPSGVIRTVAGDGVCGESGDGGPATAAELNDPATLAVDGSGDLFIADEAGCTVREVTPAGTISTVAGDGTCAESGDNGPATSAGLDVPWGLAVDSSGDLFIADFGGCRVREVTPNGTIQSVAGNGTCAESGDGGPAVNAELDGPNGLAFDSSGNLYIADYTGCVVRRVATNGVISTVAGNGTCAERGDGGPATSAELDHPDGVRTDANGDLFIPDYSGCTVREVDLSGNISTVAGDGSCTESGDGGAATDAGLAGPVAVAVGQGSLYISDWAGNTVRAVGGTGWQIAVRGTDGGGWTRNYSSNGWVKLGGLLLDAPQVVSVPSSNGPQLLFVGVGVTHLLYVRTLSTQWTRFDWTGACDDTPGVLVTGSAGDGTLTVACEGTTGELYSTTAALPASGLPVGGDWTRLFGELSAGPAVGMVDGQLVYAVVGSNRIVYLRTPTSGFARTGWACVGQPSLVDGVFSCHGVDNQLWQSRFVNGQWSRAVSFGGVLEGGVGLAPAEDFAFVTGDDRQVWMYTGSSWSPLGGVSTGGVSGVNAG